MATMTTREDDELDDELDEADGADEDDRPRSPSAVTLAGAEVEQQIRARLAGAISGAQLAKWAFDRFYQLELGVAQPEPGREELLERVLDELMFSDEAGFELDEAGLRDLLARLEAA
jgi:hypothetical protein